MATKKEKQTEQAELAAQQEQKDETSAMKLYNRLRKVPQEALKSIQAGRLKGMSDINPMWRIQMMTEAFGTCGFGWKYEIVKQWAETYGNETKVFCNINLFVMVEGHWSDPIPGTGGSAVVSSERNGVYINDEAYKMALTDALSVAMKALGVGADVYYSKGAQIVDSSTKYNMNEQLAMGQVQPSQQTPQEQPAKNGNSINPNDIFQAQEYLAKATTKEQLKWIYVTFAPLQKDPTFMGLCTQKKKELKIG